MPVSSAPPGSSAARISCTTRRPLAERSGRRRLHRHGLRPTHDAEAARQQWRRAADRLSPKLPKLAVLMDKAGADILPDTSLPVEHRATLNGIKPLERLDREVKRRNAVVDVRRAVLPLEGPLFLLTPERAAIRRLVGAILLEQNGEWSFPAPAT